MLGGGGTATAPCARWTRSGASAETSSRSSRRARARAARSTSRPARASCCPSGSRCRPARRAFPRHGLDHDELQRHADRQLYANKHGDAEHFAAGRRELTWAATLARAVDARMATPIEHSTIVARYAAGTAQRLGWSGPDLAHLRIAAMLHDIGKVVLPGPHPAEAGLAGRPRVRGGQAPPRDGRRADQPRRGTGPDRRMGAPLARALRRLRLPGRARRRAIPLASRILLVADAFDAITSDRPYRAAQSQEEALRGAAPPRRAPVRPALRRRARRVPHRHRDVRPGRGGRRLDG